MFSHKWVRVKGCRGSRMSWYKDCLLAGKVTLNYSVLHWSAVYSSCQLIALYLTNITSRLPRVVLWFPIPLSKRPSGGPICEDLFLISSTTRSFSSFFFLSPVPPPPDLNTSLNCSSCNPLSYAYHHHEGYVVLVYCQNTPKGLQTTSHNSWTWIKPHKSDKDLPKALCCWRTTIEGWDYRQQRKTLF